MFRAPGGDGWDPQDAGQLNSLDGINIPLPSLLLSFNFKFTKVFISSDGQSVMDGN